MFNYESGDSMQNSQKETMQIAWIYSTVRQFVERHPAFKIGGLRSLIFNEKANGLAKAGAIVRIGRKVLIDETRFFDWVQLQNKQGGK